MFFLGGGSQFSSLYNHFPFIHVRWFWLPPGRTEYYWEKSPKNSIHNLFRIQRLTAWPKLSNHPVEDRVNPNLAVELCPFGADHLLGFSLSFFFMSWSNHFDLSANHWLPWTAVYIEGIGRRASVTHVPTFVIYANSAAVRSTEPSILLLSSELIKKILPLCSSNTSQKPASKHLQSWPIFCQ